MYTYAYSLQVFNVLLLSHFAIPCARGRGINSTSDACSFRPENEQDLQDATRRLTEIVSEQFSGNESRTLDVLKKFELLQAHTPIPLAKYARAEGLEWANCSSDTSRMRAPDSQTTDNWRFDHLSLPSQSLLDIYVLGGIANNHGQLQRECEWSFLRPNCVFNRTLFPPIICQTRCRSNTKTTSGWCGNDKSCQRVKSKKELLVMKADRCDAGRIVWKRKFFASFRWSTARAVAKPERQLFVSCSIAMAHRKSFLASGAAPSSYDC